MLLDPVAVVLAQAQIDMSVCGARAETAEAPAVAADPVCALVLTLTDGRVPLLARFAGATVTPLLKVLIILVVAYVAHRVLQRAIKRFVRSLVEKGIRRLGALSQRAPLSDTAPVDLARATMRTETIGGVLRSIAAVVLWAIAAVMILGVFEINLAPLIAGAGIVGVALGFGAQSLVKDFLSGIFMLLEDQYGVGDIVDTGEATGAVEGITLRTTRLRDVEGTVWYVPNGEIRRVGNKSQLWARSLLDVGVAYQTDIAQACEVLKRVADELWHDPEWSEFVLEEPEVWGVERFDPDQLTIRLVIKVQPAAQWKVNRELRRRIKRAFDDTGIEIPFPQRTLWVRQGDVPAAPSGVNTGETNE